MSSIRFSAFSFASSTRCPASSLPFFNTSLAFSSMSAATSLTLPMPCWITPSAWSLESFNSSPAFSFTLSPNWSNLPLEPSNDGSVWENSTDKVPSHFYGNQQQHDTEGDFKLAGGEFVRGFDADRGKNHGCDAEDGDGG